MVNTEKKVTLTAHCLIYNTWVFLLLQEHGKWWHQSVTRNTVQLHQMWWWLMFESLFLLRTQPLYFTHLNPHFGRGWWSFNPHVTILNNVSSFKNPLAININHDYHVTYAVFFQFLLQGEKEENFRKWQIRYLTHFIIWRGVNAQARKTQGTIIKGRLLPRMKERNNSDKDLSSISNIMQLRIWNNNNCHVC